MRALAAGGLALWKIVSGIAREISDESAYARYLAAGHKTHTAGEWRSFLDRRLRAKYERAKCC